MYERRDELDDADGDGHHDNGVDDTDDGEYQNNDDDCDYYNLYSYGDDNDEMAIKSTYDSLVQIFVLIRKVAEFSGRAIKVDETRPKRRQKA